MEVQVVSGEVQKDTEANENSSLRIKKAQISVSCIFFCFGLSFITFFSRIIEIRHLLGDIDSAKISYILFACAIGNVSFTPIVGFLIGKTSVRRFMSLSPIVTGIMMISFSVAVTLGNYILSLVLSVLIGMCFGAFNVTMNIGGIAVEKRAKRTMMPRFHSFFSLGAVTATLVSQSVILFKIPFIIQHLFMGVLVGGVCLFLSRNLYEKMPDVSVHNSGEVGEVSISEHLANQAPPVSKSKIDTYLILCGIIVMAATLCEGSGNDWIASAVVEGFGVSERVGVSAMSTYLLIVAVTRFFGNSLVDRFGRFPILKFCFCLGLFGVLLFIFTPFLPLIYIAAALWGVGFALAYPIGISMSSEGSENPEFRTSIVASVGIMMNVAGPPIIGLLATAVGIRHALLFIAPFLVMAFITTVIIQKRSSSKA
jgi:MFS family permease